MPPSLNAVIAGHICLDILPDFEAVAGRDLQSLFKPGTLVQIGAAQFSGGGPVSNTGLALHHLGIPVHLIAKLGADPFGGILKAIVQGRGPGLADGLITDPQGVTSYSIIISSRATDRIFLHCTGENDTFGPEDVDFRLVEKADLFHFGYPPALKRMYRENGRDFIEGDAIRESHRRNHFAGYVPARPEFRKRKNRLAPDLSIRPSVCGYIPAQPG